MPLQRVDTHHHFIPDVLIKAVGAERLGAPTPYGRMPDWSVEGALATCDAFGIGQAILSLSPGYDAGDLPMEVAVMRGCNEAAARLRSDHPKHFGHFASVPMFDPAAALREIEYAFDVLKSNGVVVSSNYAGRYLGDSGFEEIWRELDRRKAVVFIHPTHPPYLLPSLPPESVLEYPFDTTRTAVSLVYAGVTQRYGQIRFILSHAGGTLPYLVSRAATGASFNPSVKDRVPDTMAEFRKFWFDTALSGSRSSLAALLAFADPTHILYGSDFPYAPERAIRMNIAGQEQFDMEDAQRAAIMHGNAAVLLGL